MTKRAIGQHRRRGGWWAAALCAAASVALIAAALMQRDASARPPQWTAMNAQADEALDALEAGKADAPGHGGGKAAGTDSGAKGGGTNAAGADASAGAGGTGAGMPAPGGAEAGITGGNPGTAAPNKSAADAGAFSGSGAVSADGKVDINRATPEELDELPGIGAAKAKGIADDRERNGPFKSADDLLRVKGIGPKLLEKMKSFIVLQP
ncbi:ComEA family DNA-binding protein [Paenibacillus sp. GCM10023250]|uniref:ComEA family DNA-binding protein n=1 Tax=Paenibacillus sp. GCM10023250 TaxID=3252648 RepID=UPI00360E9571